MQYIDTIELPRQVRAALSLIHFNLTSIGIHSSATFTAASPSEKGSRAIISVINMATGESTQTIGSWGGSHIFAQTIADDDLTERDLPDGFCVFQGTSGGGNPVRGFLTVNPINLAKLLPDPTAPGLTQKEKYVLRAVGYKSGYRKDECERIGVNYAPSDPTIARLISLGMIKATKAGMGLTTQGKNNRAIC